MKKIKLLLVALISVVLLPLSINAASNEKITVHIFRGEGCGYCKAALSFFDSIKEEYGQYYELEEHEVWYDEDNGTLMNDVAKEIGDSDVTGVPYIVIGKKSFSGYSEASNNDIQSAIDEAAKEDYDVMDNVDQKGSSKKDDKESSNNNLIVYISLAIIVVGVVGLLIYTKKSVE